MNLDEKNDLLYPGCKGCSILSRPGEHCIPENKSHADILIVNGSFVKNEIGDIAALSYQESEYLEDVIHRYAQNNLPTLEITASVKCPSVAEKSMLTEDFKICRKYIHETIREVNPKVIITLGNLAMKMVTGKSGVGKHRGTEIPYEIHGVEYPVIPTFNIGHVIAEPKLKFYFNADIRNVLDKYLGLAKKVHYEYEYVDSLDKLKEYDFLKTTSNNVAIDIETTGFDFRQDYIQTLSISYGEGTVVIPLFHKDSPFKDEPDPIIQWIQDIMSNPENYKIFHNSPFDLKFMKTLGIMGVNVRDTSAMAHLINEDMSKGLANLVRLYLPEWIEKL